MFVFASLISHLFMMLIVVVLCH